MVSFALFRTDLNLKKYWWHRLINVLFIITFLITLFTSVNGLFEDSQLPKYNRVGSLASRMDSKIRLIGTLVRSEEKIAVYEHNLYGSYNGKSFYEGNGGWLLEQEYYCSTNITNQVDEVVAKTGISYFKGNLDLVSLEEFKVYLAQNKANCIQILDLNSKGRYGDVKKALSWGLEADDMDVFDMSLLKSAFAIVQTLFLVSIGFFILVILYHKIFLYIVFGNTDKQVRL